MALATAVTTMNEDLQAQGKNPYRTLGETTSAEVQAGDLILHQKDNSTLRVALFPDSAWNRVDIRNAEQTPQERQKAIAEMTRPKDVIDADFFKDDEEFLYDSEVPASVAAKPASTEEKKAS